MTKKIFGGIVIIFLISLAYNIIPDMITAHEISKAEQVIAKGNERVLEYKNERDALASQTEKELKEIHNKADNERFGIKEAEEFLNRPIETNIGVQAEWIDNKRYNTDKEKLLTNTEKLGIENIERAYHLYRECSTAINQTQCYKYGIAISVAESGLFKRMGNNTNNGYGLMYKGKLMRFESVEAGITKRVQQYNKRWYNNTTPQDYLTRSRYCVSGCEHRISNVQSSLDRLNR